MGIKHKKIKRGQCIALVFIVASAPLCLLFSFTTPSMLSMVAEKIKHITISNQFDTNNLYELQWWLSNDGSFNSFGDSSLAWGKDKKKAKIGIDLDIGREVQGIRQKRPLLIAVIDTGVDIYHPAIGDGIFINSNEIKNDGVDNDSNGYIDDYMGWDFYDNDNSVFCSSNEEMIHGTATVGILIGSDKINGYRSLLSEYDVRVLCIRVLGGKSNSGSLSNIVKAIQYATDMGAQVCGLAVNTDIDSSLLKDVMSNSEMLFIVSAGNEGIDLNGFKDNYPTHYRLPNVISVADLRCDGKLSETSNYGSPYVEIAAPGTNILCAKSGGGYEFYSGTSLSVYQVVSEAALIYFKSTYVLSAPCIKRIITENVTPLKHFGRIDITIGFPNLEKALANTL